MRNAHVALTTVRNFSLLLEYLKNQNTYKLAIPGIKMFQFTLQLLLQIFSSLTISSKLHLRQGLKCK